MIASDVTKRMLYSPFEIQVKVEGVDEEVGIFELEGEDHTLGNSLRFLLCRDPDVKFAGYSMPHPNERKVLIQIQVYSGRGKSALDALELGLERLRAVTHHIKNVFRVRLPSPLSLNDDDCRERSSCEEGKSILSGE
jgi:DNA-directed RNA polymerase I and III subunit RPAC2